MQMVIAAKLTGLSDDGDTEQPCGSTAVQLAILGPTSEFRDF